MRRTKAWWAALTKEERGWLVWAERMEAKGSHGYGGGGYLPDDCRECSLCGTPTMGSTCNYCLSEFVRIIGKADAAMETSHATH